MDDVRIPAGDDSRTPTISRRAFFTRTAGLAGAAGVLLALTGCPGGDGDDGDDDDGGDDDGGDDDD